MASIAFLAKLGDHERRFDWTVGELNAARGGAIAEFKPNDPSSLSLWMTTFAPSANSVLVFLQEPSLRKELQYLDEYQSFVKKAAQVLDTHVGECTKYKLPFQDNQQVQEFRAFAHRLGRHVVRAYLLSEPQGDASSEMVVEDTPSSPTSDDEVEITSTPKATVAAPAALEDTPMPKARTRKVIKSKELVDDVDMEDVSSEVVTKPQGSKSADKAKEKGKEKPKEKAKEKEKERGSRNDMPIDPGLDLDFPAGPASIMEPIQSNLCPVGPGLNPFKPSPVQPSPVQYD
ncbi:hypothetical protein NMY22_g6946 [Coprinellus aureogranulatus]|nr:hypothetical protein NMY22_g6946 [Coprinellus aureogranulatus]